MFRILFSLAVAGAAFFGPWFAEGIVGSRSGVGEIVRAGDYYAGGTVTCLTGGTLSLTGPCAPEHGTEGLLVTAAVVLGALSAALNVLGLLPLVGRVTSLFAVAAGLAGVGAFGAVALGVTGTEGMALGDLRWGAFATGGFGLLCAVTGVRGLNGDQDD